MKIIEILQESLVVIKCHEESNASRQDIMIGIDGALDTVIGLYKHNVSYIRLGNALSSTITPSGVSVLDYIQRLYSHYKEIVLRHSDSCCDIDIYIRKHAQQKMDDIVEGLSKVGMLHHFNR